MYSARSGPILNRSSIGHHQFDLPQAHGKIKVQPHALGNDLFRKPITAIRIGWHLTSITPARRDNASDLKLLRNRIAHHERILGSGGMLYVGKHPVFGTELLIRPELVLDAVSWICKDTADWVRRATQFDVCVKLLASEPAKSLKI